MQPPSSDDLPGSRLRSPTSPQTTAEAVTLPTRGALGGLRLAIVGATQWSRLTGHEGCASIPSMRILFVVPLVLVGCGTASPEVTEPQPREGQMTRSEAQDAVPQETPIADRYREAAARIIQAAESDRGAWQKLTHLSDRIGHRLSGSRALERAIEWAVETMKAEGHENVRAEKVMVPHWVRGEERAALVAPIEYPLAILGLGGSGTTPAGGITGEVVVVSDFDELARLGSQVKGKIVLFNRAMPPYSEEKGHGYGEVVRYRGRGPSRAAALGATAALFRSATARSLRSPHTGQTRFEDGQKPIPAAAVSIEDADLIARLVASGETVRLRLAMSSRTLPDAPSANVIAELRGREKPDEIVVIGGHIDSWDVGQGAHDDAAGCAMTMQALTLLRRLGLRPRRTIRVVLFTNEENGLRGARQYVVDHAAELPRHVMALESDLGAFAPWGFSVEASEDTLRRVADIASLLRPIGGHRAELGGGGADIGLMAGAGVPLLGLRMDQSTYFDYHHSEADTLDKVNERDVARNVASVAVMAYVVADMPERLTPGTPPESH
jgi:carboxypeptidase Q